jgi:hypothetical protein
MRLFKKEEKKEEIPSLPRLPNLPHLKESEEEKFSTFDREEIPKMFPDEESSHRLPSFPSNKNTDKFSQNTIKSAIEGEREKFLQESIMDPNEKDFSNRSKDEEVPEIIEEINKQNITKREEKMDQRKEKGPVFVRIDKFEDSLKYLESSKEKISEIEKMLVGIKELKQKETQEIENWENELKELKSKIEKIEKDLSSKL